MQMRDTTVHGTKLITHHQHLHIRLQKQMVLLTDTNKLPSANCINVTTSVFKHGHIQAHQQTFIHLLSQIKALHAHFGASPSAPLLQSLHWLPVTQ